MRNKTISALLAAAILAVSLFAPLFSVSAKDTQEPRLEAISFKNAEIDGEFSSDVMSYTVTLKDNSVSPVLKSYSLKGECRLFVSYMYDEANRQTGITATVGYPTGSAIYTFTYSNPAPYEINSNNNLAEINCLYGELSPELNDKESTYRLYVPFDLTRIIITPVAQDINAYTAPVDITLSEGQETDITVSCIASDSSTRDYLIKIKRVDKTVEQVKAEMEKNDYTSFVEGTRFYEKKEFIIVAASAAGGIIILLLMYKIIKRIAVSPYDSDEKPFFED